MGCVDGILFHTGNIDHAHTTSKVTACQTEYDGVVINRALPLRDLRFAPRISFSHVLRDDDEGEPMHFHLYHGMDEPVKHSYLHAEEDEGTFQDGYVRLTAPTLQHILETITNHLGGTIYLGRDIDETELHMAHSGPLLLIHADCQGSLQRRVPAAYQRALLTGSHVSNHAMSFEEEEGIGT